MSKKSGQLFNELSVERKCTQKRGGDGKGKGKGKGSKKKKAGNRSAEKREPDKNISSTHVIEHMGEFEPSRQHFVVLQPQCESCSFRIIASTAWEPPAKELIKLLGPRPRAGES